MSEENSNILEQLEHTREEALAAIEQAADEQSLADWRARYLGRSAVVMQAFAQIGKATPEMRPRIGQSANVVKKALEAALEARQEAIREARLRQSLATEQIDVTLPGTRPARGRLHPANETLRRIYSIFAEMGFQVYQSTEVELDAINYTALNFPEHHPARDMQDTFYTTDPDVLLRTHTSPGQIHAMRQFHPDPIRVVLPGMCYRYEQISARSEIQFHQVELLAVGEHISFGDLIGTLQDFVHRLFNPNVAIRLRPNYFPFTEPSAEMDVECFICGGKGCPVCKQSGWLEILGCGMVHPNVLRAGGYDPEKYTGFAAGMGPERITMLSHHITDIRYFWSNDVRFLQQF
ncbi:MAG: phenylalanine--tRNA ligase subunit alpha [Anaerolineaceae bacterium]|nr:phenylalanine--tRNA ligase subunit alpha [Anaerolineaceae bacterium]